MLVFNFKMKQIRDTVLGHLTFKYTLSYKCSISVYFEWLLLNIPHFF